MSFSSSVPSTRLTTAQLRDALTCAAREEPGAWEHLFRLLQSFAESQVKQYLGFMPWQEQSESIQSVLESLWKDRRWVMRYEPEADPVPYVLEVVRHSVYYCMRSSNAQKRRNVVLAQDPAVPLEPELDHAQEQALVRMLEAKEGLAHTSKWMKTLSTRDRTLFWLRRFEDTPVKEVATVLNMSEDAVNQQFKRLSASLLDHLVKKGVTLLLALLVWSLPWFATWAAR